MFLSELEEGKICAVKSIMLGGCIRRRLLDLGLIGGTEVKCVNRSPHGDPTAYRIRGALIALRKCDAQNIEISSVSN